MYKHSLLLLFTCLLFLPSCKHNLDGLFGAGDESAVEFRYGPGNRKVQFEMTMTVLAEGQSEGKAIPVASNGVEYSVKKVGSHLEWNVVLDNQALFGAPQEPGPFYSVTFNSDYNGLNKRNMVTHETKVKDTLEIGKAILIGIRLPEGRYKVGQPAIPIPAEEMLGEGFQVHFLEGPPAYVYDGIKDIDGRECYLFSYHSDTVRFVQGGVEMTGSITMSAATTKNMLPVFEDTLFVMKNPVDGKTIRYAATSKEVSDAPVASSGTVAVEGQSNDIREKLKAAPIMVVSDAVELRYAPAQCRFRATSVMETGKDRSALKKQQLFNYDMQVGIAQAEGRLGWDVQMSDLSMLGEDLSSFGDINLTYTTDHSGRDIKDFVDKSNLGFFTDDDIKNDFIIPAGQVRTGDICMPVRMGQKASSFEYVFPENSGYVFQGMKEVDSKIVVVLVADVDRFVVKNRQTGVESTGKLRIVRHYAHETMLPLWFEGKVEIDRGDKGILVTNADFVRVE